MNYRGWLDFLLCVQEVAHNFDPILFHVKSNHFPYPKLKGHIEGNNHLHAIKSTNNSFDVLMIL